MIFIIHSYPPKTNRHDRSLDLRPFSSLSDMWHVCHMYAHLCYSLVFWQWDAEEIDQFLREQRLEDLHRKIQALTPEKLIASRRCDRFFKRRNMTPKVMYKSLRYDAFAHVCSWHLHQIIICVHLQGTWTGRCRSRYSVEHLESMSRVKPQSWLRQGRLHHHLSMTRAAIDWTLGMSESGRLKWLKIFIFEFVCL